MPAMIMSFDIVRQDGLLVAKCRERRDIIALGKNKRELHHATSARLKKRIKEERHWFGLENPWACEVRPPHKLPPAMAFAGIEYAELRDGLKRLKASQGL